MTACTPYENMKPVQSCSLLTKCCFCIPLRTGCFILGYLSLLLNLLFTLLCAATLAIMATLTRGFRYNPMKQTLGENSDNDADEMSKMHMAIMVVMLVGCLNVAWVMLNAFLLISLHKRRPGSIRIHVAIATVRLLLSGLGLSTVNTINTGYSFRLQTSAFCWVEIGLSAYFIMLYYVYAMQMDQELRSEEVTLPQDIIAVLNRRRLFLSNPKNIDKEMEKDNIKVINV